MEKGDGGSDGGDERPIDEGDSGSDGGDTDDWGEEGGHWCEVSSLEQVTEALARAGLESSNRRGLHHIGDGLNPYEQAITIIGKTLAAFDEDNLIPCYGFGDASTHDQDVFSFYPEERFCNGFVEVLTRYREIVPHLKLAGPTSFAPVIEQAMTIVKHTGTVLIYLGQTFTRIQVFLVQSSIICNDKGHEILVADVVNLPYRTWYGDAAISIVVLHHLSTEHRRKKSIDELVLIKSFTDNISSGFLFVL
ncbi:Copine [Cynara cardunculus var. scolymus]|uniref:Copine n=1 Tax=Cynara cardunculus var. scolymus TaxID=59895 RepID=A0A103SSU4_CYNCS|nr:Copine [Cynara cardunculus var. scolymus]